MFAPFCQSMWWKPNVYPGMSSPLPITNPKVSSLVSCFAIATSSAPLAGTLGRPSGPASPASFMIFRLKYMACCGTSSGSA